MYLRRGGLLGVLVLSACLGAFPYDEVLGTLGHPALSREAQAKVHPVILVHGLGSTYDRWYEQGTIYYTLQADGYAMDYVWAFAYPPGPDQEDSSGDIRLIADRLAQELDRLSRASIEAGGPAKVDIVAHSLGGLITRRYLSQHLSDHKIDKFVDMGTPHRGSMLMLIYNQGMDGLADYICPSPVNNWLARKAIDTIVHESWRALNLSRFCPASPMSPAAQQLDPAGAFMAELNQPRLSPESVDYSMIYGDITLGLETDIFGIPIVSGEILSVGDMVVARDNASTIPHLGSRQGPNPSNYHAYAFPSPVSIQYSLDLLSPGITFPDLETRLQQAWDVTHRKLVINAEVNELILSILNEGPSAPPEEAPTGGGKTATVFLLDISGSMGEAWQGGIKIESAKTAALNVLDMIEQDSQVGGVSHQAAVATFSSGAWLDLPLTNDYTQVQQVIRSLAPQGGTNLGAGLQRANGALAGVPDAKKIIILLSDGLTNEGMPSDQILSGPVQEAAESGTCIYTIGFGDPGDLDEDLLRRIAQAACGQYAYADTPYDLETIYVRFRHQSLGQIIDEFSGQVTQGETTPARSVEVPRDQRELHVTLNWPGSRLDMLLTDPNGRRLDTSYPGVTLATYARMAYMIITDPLPGLWQVAVKGVDVPEGIIDYNAILSVRPVILSTDGAPLLVLIVLSMLLAAGGSTALLLRSRSRLGAAVPSAGVQIIAEPGRWAGFRRGMLRIGREPVCELVLSDPCVSRLHAQILKTPQGYLIEDLGSRNGTLVNGERVSRQYLHHNDQLQVGDTRLTFWEQRERQP